MTHCIRWRAQIFTERGYLGVEPPNQNQNLDFPTYDLPGAAPITAISNFASYEITFVLSLFF